MSSGEAIGRFIYCVDTELYTEALFTMIIEELKYLSTKLKDIIAAKTNSTNTTSTAYAHFI